MGNVSGNRKPAGVAPARVVAVALLGEQRRRGAHARDLLRGSYRMESLSARDRAFATRLVLGVVSTSGAVDKVLNRYLRRPGGLEPKVRDALRLSAYEMLYLGTDPAIAVSQGVELVRRVRAHAAGLANAVLRRVAEGDVPRFREAEARVREAELGDVDTAEVNSNDLALVAGVPSWIAEGVLYAYGTSGAAEWALAQREPAPVCVANNLRAQSDEVCLNVLKSRDFRPEDARLVGAWRLGKSAHLAKSGLVDAVRVLPADLSTQLVARVAAPKPGEVMLEVGQGRGTKTILALNDALRIGGEAQVVGVDSAEFKCAVARGRFQKAGWGSWAQAECADAPLLSQPEQVPESLRRAFDVVLVDAPCSGVGTLRRHPEIAWSLERDAVEGEGAEALPTLQFELLRAAAARVRPGGALVYTTCSFMAAEDERVVERFLKTEEGSLFSVAPVVEAPAVAAIHQSDPADVGFEVLSTCTLPGGFVRIAPTEGYDQHFCARLVRSAS